MTGIRIVRLAARGDGVDETGRFIPGAVPGDRVDGDAVQAGPHRAEPVCRHFGRCGACQLQHVDDETIAAFARGRIESALAKAGLAAEMWADTHVSPPKSRRRASLRAQTVGGALRVGFNEESSRQVVEIDECHVLTPALFALSQALREPLMDLMPKDWICGLTLTETAAGHDVLISNLPEEAAGSAFGPDWMQANGVARISAEDRGAAEPIAQAAQPSVTLGDMAVAFPAGAFLQATVDAEAALQRAVLDFTGGAARVADLFCGLGTFGSVLAANSRVTAVDASGPSVSALAAAAGAQSLPIKTLHRDLFRRPLSPKELSAFDAVVLDPPRAGARLQCEMAAKAELGRLAYVSCNPATFARDAEILVAGGFTLKEVRPVAQFRWSTHVELAARFER